MVSKVKYSLLLFTIILGTHSVLSVIIFKYGQQVYFSLLQKPDSLQQQSSVRQKQPLPPSTKSMDDEELIKVNFFFFAQPD